MSNGNYNSDMILCSLKGKLQAVLYTLPYIYKFYLFVYSSSSPAAARDAARFLATRPGGPWP